MEEAFTSLPLWFLKIISRLTKKVIADSGMKEVFLLLLFSFFLYTYDRIWKLENIRNGGIDNRLPLEAVISQIKAIKKYWKLTSLITFFKDFFLVLLVFGVKMYFWVNCTPNDNRTPTKISLYSLVDVQKLNAYSNALANVKQWPKNHSFS